MFRPILRNKQSRKNWFGRAGCRATMTFRIPAARSIIFSCSKSTWPPRLVAVPGLHGSEGAHWQSWLERQFSRSLRVEQADWDAPELARWAKSLRDLLACERGPFVLAAHSFGCLATAHAL